MIEGLLLLAIGLAMIWWGFFVVTTVIYAIRDRGPRFMPIKKTDWDHDAD